MKHQHICHCGLKDQLRRFKAGKLGLLGGILILGHLLFHVAECLIIPAILFAIHRQPVEAVEGVLEAEIVADTEVDFADTAATLQEDFYQTLQKYYPLRP